MESRIISLFLLMAAGGCCAILPIPYLAFGVQRVPAQQFIYHPPQRNFLQQQFIPNYEALRYPQPQSYSQPQFYVQPQPYVHQPQHYPYNLYNAPQPLRRDAVSPVFADHYDTVLHYVQRQPVVPFPTYVEKPRLHQGPPYLLKDCQETDLKEETIYDKIVAGAQTDPAHVRRMSSDLDIAPAEPLIVNTRISDESNTKTTIFGAAITDEQFGNPAGDILQENAPECTNSEDKVGTANPANSQEGILENNTSKSTHYEDKVTTANPENPQAQSMNSKDEATTANPGKPQEKILQDLIAESTASLGKIPIGDSANPQEGIINQKTEKSTNPEAEVAAVGSAAPQEVIPEETAARLSDSQQQVTSTAPIEMQEEIPEATNAESTNPELERTESTETETYQQNPTVVNAPVENNESLAASNSAETASESTSTASN